MSAPEDQAAPSSRAADGPLVESPVEPAHRVVEQSVVESPASDSPVVELPVVELPVVELPVVDPELRTVEAEHPADEPALEESAPVLAPVAEAPRAAAPLVASTSEPEGPRPTYVFLGVVAGISLILDIATKAWAEVTLNRRGFEPLELIDGHLAITLAYNRGGAWGILQDVGEMVRKPFFLTVSAAAIWFIVSLYGRLHKSQRALTWGLPLVLGGALGNLSDRITRSQVVDFIDYRANWVAHMNGFIHKYVPSWTLTDHWPTFNVADIAISVGVGLMAIDMFTAHRRGEPQAAEPQVAEPPQPSERTESSALDRPESTPS